MVKITPATTSIVTKRNSACSSCLACRNLQAAPSRARTRSSHGAVLLGELRSCRRARALSQHVAASKSSRPFEAISTKKNTMPVTSQSKFFETEMTVRDCELDQYGFVNDAVYACYIEKAREEMFTSFGLGMSSVAGTGLAMAISKSNFKYFAPLKRGAKFVVMVRVAQTKGVRVLLEYFVETWPERKLVLEATATGVCLNEDYRPTRVFPEMSEMLDFFS